MINSENVKIFAGTSNRDLAKKIAEKYGLPLGKADVVRFKDGEVFVKIDETVRGRDVFVVQSTSEPVTENLMEILVLADALKRASAGEITAIMPYFGYARQDRKSNPREPITSKLVANLLTKSGATRIIAMDLHADQIQGFFDIPVDHMQALPLMVRYFMKKGLYGDDVVVVSPDIGGVKRARKLAEWLDCKIAIIDKRRPKPNVAEIMGVLGDVEGKNCIMIDDMIDTGGTIVAGIDMLLEKGAKNVFVACTHPVFSGPAVERLKNCSAKEVVVTDTIILPEEKKFDKLKVVSVASLLAKTIESIENNLAVSDVFQEFDFEK